MIPRAVLPVGRRRWDRARRTATAFVLTAIAGLVLWYINVLRVDLTTALVITVVVGAIVTLLTWVMSEESPRLKPAYWFASMRQESTRPSAMDYRIMRLRRDLRDATERSDRTDEIFPLVRALAAERLAAHHDIDLATDPDAGQALMHPDLVKYLSHPPTDTHKRSKREIARALDRIEEL